jgi:hypothetical protein
MIVDDPAIAKRIADLIRRLSSPSDGEIIATVHALQRTLETNGLDIHAIADPLEAPNGKHIPEEQMQKVWDAAYARGVQDTENRQHGSDDFIGTDGKPTWQAVALFLQRNKDRLTALDPTRNAAPLSAFGLTPVWVRFTPTFDS